MQREAPLKLGGPPRRIWGEKPLSQAGLREWKLRGRGATASSDAVDRLTQQRARASSGAACVFTMETAEFDEGMDSNDDVSKWALIKRHLGEDKEKPKPPPPPWTLGFTRRPPPGLSGPHWQP